MKNDNLIVLVAGMSSRMRKSIPHTQISKTVAQVAMQQHKSLIPLGKQGKPLLFYLLGNARQAGITTIYLVTSVENDGFKKFISRYAAENELQGLSFRYAVQHIPEGAKKPQGTADALLQCLEQYPQLRGEQFTVCNGDNLYSMQTLFALRDPRISPHALIAYDRSGLTFTDEKITKFALLRITNEGFLSAIVEKPDRRLLDGFRDLDGKLRVSMNIFNFTGSDIYTYLKNCPVHPVRLEKELPAAVRGLIRDQAKGMWCIPFSEHVPDLTSAEDISRF
ncbi:MAG: sugar phosphate nucleotidyltransferase [Bacteroidota bacterium]